MFGYGLMALRTAKGWSRDALAQRAGLTPQAIWLLETDKREPTLATLNKLALAFTVTRAELLGQVDNAAAVAA